MQPIVKWAGGKRFLAQGLAQVLKVLDAHEYVEPFAGGAAVFFALEGSLPSMLSDSNGALIEFYGVVKKDPEALIAAVQRLGRGESSYYRVRASQPRTTLGRAARLYYLTRFSFNGIYRENLRGEFNVPFGYKEHLALVDRAALLNASRFLASARLVHADYRDVLGDLAGRRIIYADPPYTVKHNNNGFIKYNRRLFAWSDQRDLAVLLAAQAKAGSYVFVSNAAHNDVAALYPTFVELQIERRSVMAACSSARGPIRESLFVSTNVISALVRSEMLIGNY